MFVRLQLQIRSSSSSSNKLASTVFENLQGCSVQQTLLGSSRRARLAPPSRFSGRTIQVAILLPRSRLVVILLHLVHKQVLPCLEVLPLVYLVQLNNLLPSLPLRLSGLHLHQLSVVQRLLLGQLQLRHSVIHHHHRLEDHPYSVRSLLLEVLALLLLKQVHLEVPLNHHNQHLEAAYLVRQHLLAHHLSQHLVQLAHLHLVLRAPQHLVL